MQIFLRWLRRKDRTFLVVLYIHIVEVNMRVHKCRCNIPLLLNPLKRCELHDPSSCESQSSTLWWDHASPLEGEATVLWDFESRPSKVTSSLKLQSTVFMRLWDTASKVAIRLRTEAAGFMRLWGVASKVAKGCSLSASWGRYPPNPPPKDRQNGGLKWAIFDHFLAKNRPFLTLFWPPKNPQKWPLFRPKLAAI